MIGKTISHYKIVDKLGEGGMGAVYKAEDTTLNRLVAIKTLSRQLSENEEARERFVREAQAASALNHTNITTIHELLEDEGEQYIVMEYVEGKTIRDIVESSRVSIRKAVDIIIQAAEALEAAHNKGILHRDVKSANIMVSMEGNVKVMDFGLAHLEERSQLTRTGTTMGTLAYSSPEQLIGKPVDKRSEIFSLGVVFYELLARQLPFKSPSEGELVFEIINTEQEMLTTCREDVPDNVCAVVNKMLTKQPELRYQSCGELLIDLEAIRGELETSTVHISGIVQPAGLSSRRRTIRTGITIGSAAVVLTAFYFLVLSPRQVELPSLALLPFQHIGLEDETELINGLSNQTQSRLQNLSGLIPLAYYSPDEYNSSGKSYQEIGNDLGADYLLKGSVQRIMNPDGSVRLRIDPQLIRASDGHALGMDPVEESIQDLFQITAKLATQVARELGATVRTAGSGTAPSDDSEYANLSSEAVESYLRGIGLFSRRRTRSVWEASIAALQRAVDIEPDFADANVMLSIASSWGIWQKWYPEGEEQQARTAAAAVKNKAWELAPGSGKAYMARGYYRYWCNKEYESALDDFQEALKLRPNDPDCIMGAAFVQRRLGQWESGIEKLRQATRLAPLNSSAWGNLGEFACVLHLYDEAIEASKQALTFDPGRRWAYFTILQSYLGLGDLNGAAQFLEDIPSEPFEGLHISWWMGAYSHTRAIARMLPEKLLETIQRIPFTTEARSGSYTLWNYYMVRAEAAFTLGRVNEGRAYCDSILARSDEYRSTTGYDPAVITAWMGEVETAGQMARQIMQTRSEMELDALDILYGETSLPEIAVRLGDYETAINYLTEMVERPSYISPAMLRLDPLWEPLRSQPRFQALLRKYN